MQSSGRFWKRVRKIREQAGVRENGGWRTEMKRSNNSHGTSTDMLCEHIILIKMSRGG